MPSAAEMDVLACPTLKASWALSSRRGKPAMPPYCLRVSKTSLRPVMSL